MLVLAPRAKKIATPLHTVMNSLSLTPEQSRVMVNECPVFQRKEPQEPYSIQLGMLNKRSSSPSLAISQPVEATAPSTNSAVSLDHATTSVMQRDSLV